MGYTERETESERTKIMSAKSLTRRALNLAGTRAPRPTMQGTPLSSPRAVMVRTGSGSLIEMDAREVADFQAQGLTLDVVAPVTPGHDDSVVIFRSWLLRTQGDGCELRAALDRMAARAPKIADQVIFAGSLGEVSRGRAVASLRTYLATGVAQAPMGL